MRTTNHKVIKERLSKEKPVQLANKVRRGALKRREKQIKIKINNGTKSDFTMVFIIRKY